MYAKHHATSDEGAVVLMSNTHLKLNPNLACITHFPYRVDVYHSIFVNPNHYPP